MAKVHGFTPDAARRIAEAVKAIERWPKTGNPGRGRYPVSFGGGGASSTAGPIRVEVTEEISPFYGGFPGSGKVKRIRKDPYGAYETYGDAFPVENMAEQEWPVGARGWAQGVPEGGYSVVSMICP